MGTKTTRANVLDTLYKRGYVTGRRLTVTPLGSTIYDTFNKHSPKIVDPSLTRQLEEEMEGIQEGKIEQEKVIADAKIILTEILADFSKKEKEIGGEILEKLKETEAFAACSCGGSLRVLQKGKSRFLGCTNYPTCRITYSLPYGFFTYAGQCPQCNAPEIWVFKGKQRYKLCLNKECVGKIRKEQKAKVEPKKIKKEKKIGKVRKTTNPKRRRPGTSIPPGPFCSCSLTSLYLGMVKLNLLPLAGGFESTSSFPPCCSIISFEIARPKPVPSFFSLLT